MPTEQSERLSQSDYKTIAEMRFGTSPYLLRQNDAADIRLEFMDPERDKLAYFKETRNLPPESVVSFPELATGRLTIAQLGLQSPQVRWSERTSGVDEPTLTFSAKHATKNQPQDIDVSEKELLDLFLPRPGKDRKAAFFTLDTTSHEMVGISLKRSSPVMLLLTPGKDGMQYSPQIGLKVTLDNIYEKLTENLTDFQSTIDRRVFDALGPDGNIEFTFDANTPAKLRQRDIQKKIYQIKALLLATQAEESESGYADTALLNHAPYLAKPAQPEKHGGGLWGRLMGGGEEGQHGKTVKVGNTIWTGLVAPLESRLFIDPQAEAQRRQASTARPTAPPQPVYEAPRQAQRPSSPVQPAPRPPRQPVRAPEVRPLTEKEKALQLAKGLSLGLETTLKLFQGLAIEQLGPQQATQLQQRIEALHEQAQAYSGQRRQAQSPENPVATKIMARQGSITVAGVKDVHAFEFLTGDVDGDYKMKVESVFSAWSIYVRPIYVSLGSLSERQYSSVKENREFRQQEPKVFRKLFIETEKILNSLGQSRPGDIQLGTVAHVLLGQQLVYTLHEQYQQIAERGRAAEVDNWASYCGSMLARFEKLLPEAIKDRRRK